MARGVLRLLLLAFVVAGLAPGTFLRTPTGLRSDPAVVSVSPAAVQGGDTAGALTLSGAWELRAAQGWFGGLSALTAGEGAALIAGSDRGFLLDLDLTGGSPRAVSGSYRFVGESRGRDETVDLESLARDPARGTLWAGFEADNLVMRLSADGTRRLHAPPEMAGWGLNSGAETFERLADGRFLAIAEGAEDGSETAHAALLYPGDPLDGGTPVAFSFVGPPGYDPVDATQLPDGRMLILLRRVRLAIPARFDTAIAVADPRAIRPQAAWRARVIQRLAGGILAENFEGIAYLRSAGDPARGSLWLIADDNFSTFQRSLLVRFDWPPGGEAPAP
jgi:hypothetical protein